MRGFKHLTWTALVLLSAPAGAAVLHVPGEAQTIAQGVAAASPGDTVVVACGTYVEHDVVLDREITRPGTRPASSSTPPRRAASS